jgi:hypothetical protein
MMKRFFAELWAMGENTVRTLYNSFKAFVEAVRDVARTANLTAEAAREVREALDSIEKAWSEFKVWVRAKGFQP